MQKLKAVIEPHIFVKIVLIAILLLGFPWIGKVSRLFFKGVPFWAGFILLMHCSEYKNVLSKKYFWLIIVFDVSYVITLIVNFPNGLFASAKHLVWFVIYTFILLSWPHLKKYSSDEVKKHVLWLHWAIVFINMCNVFVSVGAYILNLGIHIDKDRIFGIYTDRLYGLAIGINESSAIAYLSMLSAFLIIKNSKSGRWRKLLVANIICSCIYVLAGGSRAARYSMTFCIILIICMTIWKKHKGREGIKLNTLVMCGGAGILCFCIIECLRYPVGLLPNIGYALENRNFDQQLAIGTGDEIHTSDDGIHTSIVIRDREGEDFSTIERKKILEECLDLWKDYPIFGIGANMKLYADRSGREYSNINKENGCSVHNTPVAILLYSGLSGFVIIVVYFVAKFVCIAKEILRGKASVNIEVEFAACMSLFLYSLAGTCILFSNVECTVLFWIYLGMIEAEQACNNIEEK